MEQEENILGTEKVGKLIRAFSIPCIISMLVNSLYNIVDQIFIGQGVGYLGNGATNVVFPLVMIGLAFSLMFGDGASAYLSLKLGEKKKKEAEQGIGNGIVISSIVSVLFSVITLIFLQQFLTIFGCTDNLRELATTYGIISNGKLIEEITAKQLSEKCRQYIDLKVDDTARAVILLERELGISDYEVLEDSNIKVFSNLDNVGEVNSLLSRSGIIVESISVKGENLEEYFMNKVGGVLNA